MGPARRVPGHMLPHLPHGRRLSLKFHHHFPMTEHHGLDLFAGRLWGNPSGFQVFRDPLENPGVSFGSPGHHHPVAAGFCQHPLGCLRRIHISVSDYRDGNRLLHLADDLPIRLSGIVLLPGPSMNRHRRRAASFCDPGDLHRVDGLIVKALSDLHCHRLF